MALSYTPWMSKLVPDIDLAYVNYTKALSDRQGISASLRYFSLGEINFTDEQGNSMGTFNPYEFYFDVAYALKLSDHWSAGTALALNFFRSNPRNISSRLANQAGTEWCSGFRLLLPRGLQEHQRRTPTSLFRGNSNDKPRR